MGRMTSHYGKYKMFETTNQDLVCTHLWHSLVLSGVTTWWHVDHLLKVNLW